MKQGRTAALALVGWFLFLAAAMIIFGAGLSGLTIRDLEETILKFWPNFLVYLGVSTIVGYLVAVLKRRARVTPNDPRLKPK